RLPRAGLEGWVEGAAVLAAMAACAIAAIPFALAAAPAAPGRLSLLVAVGLPAAGFIVPDALLERRARRRARRLVGALPDALDLLAVGAASGRNPANGMAEIASTQDGPLARELGITVAELGCGISQAEALGSLKGRAPGAELASLVAVIERSGRYGSPLADRLREQASAQRADQRRRVEEQAARAAPKIQLAVALLLVPSVLLMIAAALLANAGLLTSGF
ncbi:MAG: type II secretion system F family protein, partial [Solirubrobacterales bacterium]